MRVWRKDLHYKFWKFRIYVGRRTMCNDILLPVLQITIRNIQVCLFEIEI